MNNKKAQEKKTSFHGIALGLLCIGLPEPIERTPTQSNGLSSVGFDLFD